MNTKRGSQIRLIASLLCLFWLCSGGIGAGAWQAGNEPARPAAPGLEGVVYLPAIYRAGAAVPQVNAPYQTGEVILGESAIFWFGRVTPAENYADVRIGYNERYLRVNVQVFDRRLWYQTDPAGGDFPRWDSVTLYLDTGGWGAESPGATAYRIDGMLNWWEPRDGYQAVYQGSATGWLPRAVPVSTVIDWRGDSPNNDVDDRGWWIMVDIPFSSLGLSKPPHEAVWGLATSLHDRDSEAEAPIAGQLWPPRMQPGQPATWGRLHFGLPTYTPPAGGTGGRVTIRHKLNDVQVQDGMVGGSTVCGEGLEYWTEWGEKNWAGAEQVNIQNERDVSDWPCFSKFYLTFPLDQVPPGKAIRSARLTLFSIGNAGGGQWGEAPRSLVQVLTVGEPWDEATLTWNNAPLAVENVGQAWVDPLLTWPGPPGVPQTWDISYAVDQAYRAGEPLRIALYSADEGYHTGRYFTSSDTGDWNAIGRPTLDVDWVDR